MQTLNTRRIAIVIGLIMGLGALVGTFLVLTKAESTSSNGESGSGDSKNIDRSTAANDPPLQTDTTDEAAVDLRTPDAFESSIPLAELFSALETACKMSDVEGIRMVLRTLFDRDIDEVAEASLRRLDGTSDKNSGLPEFSPPPQGLYRTYLLYLAGRAYPERLFSELRAWWSEPDMTLARRNEWTRINRKPTARLAKDALPPDDRWQARASGSVLVDYAKEGQASGLAVYALLERLYGGELPQGEVPDPWLSEVVDVIGKHLPSLQPDHATEIRRALTAMASNDSLSARLRAQIRLLLVPECAEFAELLMFCESAEQLDECAEALKQYLLRSELSRDELRILLQLLFQRHSLRTNEPNRFMERVAEASADPAGKERLRTMATDLLHLAIEQPAGTYWPALVELIEGLRGGITAWHGLGPRSRATLFGGDQEAALDLIVRCREQAARDPNLQRRKSLTESRMISWIWTLTGSVDWKAQAVADLLRDRNYVHKNDFNAIMQGLAAYADEIAVKPSEQVTGLVRRTLEESDYGDGFETPLAMTSWEALIWVHSVSKVLLALRLPSLGELAEAKIARVARAVLDAAPNWPSDARAGTTESLSSTEEILATYS